jgi:glycosyltransferase involved in cell wall biosynthesis
MRILEITAGAAQMYCGSCIRDNALAAELLRQGHDVTLLPLYTPTLTDEQNVSDPHVFFGGISVYLEQHSAIFRKTPRALDRLWDSHWALKLASRHSIAVNPHLLGEMAVSMLRGPDGFQQKEIEKLVTWLRSQPQPDIVTLPNSLLISLAQPIREAVNRPVCCTLQGEDLFLSQLPEPYRTTALELIQANVDHVAGFAAVSDTYAGFMSRFIGIPASKMHVVPLGINLEGYAPGSRAGDGFTAGYFARLAPEKGLHLLAESYLHLRHSVGQDAPPFRLEAAGYLAPEHRDYLHGIERKMKDAGLAHEFHYRGVLDRVQKIDFLRSLDILSVPSTYDEPKGIFLLEAMACGVPVVQPRRGAFPEILDKTGGGMLVAPDDAASLAEGILSLWKDPARRAELGRRGAEGVAEHYSVQRMAARALEVYGEISEARVHA